ncbi:hypothetical protein [Desertibacillus haloalkaliphilus]|nr:hypothetical protein [Desertibacillus haloalkaliphilus]MBU8905297.1 hypothetical protein [Desertibacillus haloalkaliphilus]
MDVHFVYNELVDEFRTNLGRELTESERDLVKWMEERESELVSKEQKN